MALKDYRIWIGIAVVVIVLFVISQTTSGLANVNATTSGIGSALGAPAGVPSGSVQGTTVDKILSQGATMEDIQAKNFVDALDGVDNSVDLLNTGVNYNINTTPSIKNRNRQLRSDPPVTEVDTGFFNNSVIIPDYTTHSMGV